MKSLTCIVCPNGCRISCELVNGEYRFTGNACARGVEYAAAEMTRPMRTLCTTVKTVFPGVPALPVRTSAPIPKERLLDVICALAAVCVGARLSIGDVVVPSILGLDCDILATSNILKEAERRK